MTPDPIPAALVARLEALPANRQGPILGALEVLIAAAEKPRAPRPKRVKPAPPSRWISLR